MFKVKNQTGAEQNDHMNDSKATLTKKDLFIVLGTALFTGLLAAAYLGFWQLGFKYPYNYGPGGDEYSILVQAKELAQQKWLWSTERLGAPFGQNMLDYPSILLQNTEYLSMKFWSLWTKDPAVIVNIQFLMTFILCSVTAYLVLRKMAVTPLFSVCGALLFSFSPYIYARGLGHYCLSACYFIPLSVYLCYTAYSREDLLKRRTFAEDRRENVLLLLICFCIANNGIGYYPFFSCFLLCVTAVCKGFETRDIRKTLPALKLVLIITLFMLLLLVPSFHYSLVYGRNDITSRNLQGVEIYGLKITQLFIPLRAHEIGFIKNLIERYNRMPLVNENSRAYLGAVAGVGFIFQMLCFFGIRMKNEHTGVILLASRLSLASVLFMSVGGFISLLSTLLNIDTLRGFNRISIYLMFLSITVLCFLGELLLERIKGALGRRIFLLLTAAVTIFGIWEQSPDIGRAAKRLEAGGIQWVKDAIFIEKIEDTLQPGDMVFQLPYLPYPEGKQQNDLSAYRHLIGFLHSDTLRWSFGGIKGREGDRWYREVSQMDCEQMIKTLIAAGFRGLYIDRSGYKEEEFIELQRKLSGIRGMKHQTNEDDVIWFYDLYPVIRENPEYLQAASGSAGNSVEK